MKLPVIVLGCGGHAKVLIDALLAQSMRIIGITDPARDKSIYSMLDIPVIGTDEEVLRYNPDGIQLVNGLGSVRTTTKRKDLFERFKNVGYCFASVIHPSAIIARDVIIKEGVQVMAGAVIQTGSEIGANSIINTRVSIDHDCIISDHVHLAPGSTLSGGVQIGDGTHIGTGVTVIQGVTIGKNCLIGAGSLVLQDIPDNVKAYGVPAKEAKM